MVNCLREEFIYSEKRARDAIFDAFEEIVGETGAAGSRLILSKLTREAAARARRASAAFEFTKWETAAKAVAKAMLGAGVLLADGGTPIPVSVAAHATEVAGLASGYRDRTEEYLLEFLIRRLGDVGPRDHTALAHALFRQFDPGISLEDMEDRVVLLLAMLADRVVIDNGVYRAL